MVGLSAEPTLCNRLTGLLLLQAAHTETAILLCNVHRMQAHEPGSSDVTTSARDVTTSTRGVTTSTRDVTTSTRDVTTSTRDGVGRTRSCLVVPW